MTLMRCVLATAFAAVPLFATAAPRDPATAPLLERISASSMRGNLSFLASDALEAGSISRPNTSPPSSVAPAWNHSATMAIFKRPTGARSIRSA
jgi:hypothetical protein